jgi:hypothetical protein
MDPGVELASKYDRIQVGSGVECPVQVFQTHAARGSDPPGQQHHFEDNRRFSEMCWGRTAASVRSTETYEVGQASSAGGGGRDSTDA